MSTTPTTPQWHPQVSEACWLNHNDAIGTKSAVVVLNVYRGGNAKVWDESKHSEKECSIASLSPRETPWAVNVTVADGKYTVRQSHDGKLEALRYGEPWRDLTGDGLVLALAQAVESAPALPPPTDEAKLREQVMDAVLTYIHEAYFNGGVRNPMFDANLLTDRLLTALAPHLSQREPGDSELLDWLEKTPGSCYASIDSDGDKLMHFVAVPELPVKDRRGYVAKTVRAAIKSAIRGEGKP